ncbi:MAG: MBL fold metallo-hydrolase [Acidobacteriota bacterium]
MRNGWLIRCSPILILVACFGSNGQSALDGGRGKVWTSVGPGVYLFRDCANVYAVVERDRACLIGFAGGRALDHLAEIGVSKVDQILVTHHHRDGLQGIKRAVEAGIRIVIPAEESAFIKTAEQHWASKRVFVNYQGASRFNAVTSNGPVSREVSDGDVIDWGGDRVRVLRTPGHTPGSITYLLSRDGKTIAFTGDLYTASGKTLTYYDLDWGYGARTFPKPLEAIAWLRAQTPLLVCPEHSRPFEEDGGGLDQFKSNLDRASEVLMPNNLKAGSRKPSHAFGPHLVFVGEPVTYTLVSDSRHAIIVDPGYLSETDLENFLKKYEIQSVDAVTFTHYHDDHVARTYETVYTWTDKTAPVKTQVWVFDAMADVLAHPNRYNIPCLYPLPIHATRVIREDEIVRWEGLDLRFNCTLWRTSSSG